MSIKRQKNSADGYGGNMGEDKIKVGSKWSLNAIKTLPLDGLKYSQSEPQSFSLRLTYRCRNTLLLQLKLEAFSSHEAGRLLSCVVKNKEHAFTRQGRLNVRENHNYA